MNYGELKSLTLNYLECDETTFNTNFPMFVRLAEEDIYRSVQLPDLRKNSTAVLSSGDQYLATPEDYLSAYSLALIVSGSHQFLLSKDVSYMREAFPSASSTGVPRFFAQFDDANFILAPTPNDSYQVELHYFYQPTSLAEDEVDGNTTWLSENAENALLFGTIYQGYIYLKGDQDVIAMYKGQFDKAISDLKTINEGRIRKDSYRTSDRRIPT